MWVWNACGGWVSLLQFHPPSPLLSAHKQNTHRPANPKHSNNKAKSRGRLIVLQIRFAEMPGTAPLEGNSLAVNQGAHTWFHSPDGRHRRPPHGPVWGLCPVCAECQYMSDIIIKESLRYTESLLGSKMQGENVATCSSCATGDLSSVMPLHSGMAKLQGKALTFLGLSCLTWLLQAEGQLPRPWSACLGFFDLPHKVHPKTFPLDPLLFSLLFCLLFWTTDVLFLYVKKIWKAVMQYASNCKFVT